MERVIPIDVIQSSELADRDVIQASELAGNSIKSELNPFIEGL